MVSSPEDAKKVTDKGKVIQEERKKFPDRYPKPLTPSYTMAVGKGVRLYEATEEQLIHLIAFWAPEGRWKFIPIFESTNVREAWNKMNE